MGDRGGGALTDVCLVCQRSPQANETSVRMDRIWPVEAKWNRRCGVLKMNTMAAGRKRTAIT